MIYSLILGLMVYLTKLVRFIGYNQSKFAENLIAIFIGILIAKLAVSTGQSIDILIQMGPILLIKEIGVLGSLLALPFALILGFKREVIGMTSSICREPDLGVIITKYGFKSSESRGVLTVYIIGSVLGTVFISLISSVCASLIPLHPYAFAMAAGVGSVSMSVAALTSLLQLFPSMATNLEAFAGCSNLITSCIGIYWLIFVSLPLAEKLYSFCISLKNCKKEKDLDVYDLDDDLDDNFLSLDSNLDSKLENNLENEHSLPIDSIYSKESKFDLTQVGKWFILLIIFSSIVSIVNWVGFNNNIINTFIGMLILSVITILALILEKNIKFNIPSIVYVSIIGIILSIPLMPSSGILSFYVSNINVSTICTVFLAYVGIGIGNDWYKFKKMGLRGIFITFMVIGFTFLISAFVSQGALSITGII